MTDTITTQPFDFPTDRVATPLREDRLVIRPSFVAGAFDSHAVDLAGNPLPSAAGE